MLVLVDDRLTLGLAQWLTLWTVTKCDPGSVPGVGMLILILQVTYNGKLTDKDAYLGTFKNFPPSTFSLSRCLEIEYFV